MAETNAPPTEAEVLLIRNDLMDLIASIAGRTLDSYIVDSLAECKRILEDDRGILWTQVYDTTGDAYLDNSDSTGRNEDRIKNAMSHMAAAMVFRDYSIKFEEAESWTMLAEYHEQKAIDRLTKSKLDIDIDESGAIDDDEEMLLGQVFFVK